MSSVCALARAAASAATDSLDRAMARLRLQEIKAHCPGFRAFGAHPMADRFLGVFWHQRLEFGSCPFVVEKGRPRIAKQSRKLGPGVRETHVDDPDDVEPGAGWLRIGEVRRLTGLHAAPEFLLS